MIDIIIRKETPDDFAQVARLIEMAFCQKNEAMLVEKLRHNKKYNPMLSIVADYGGYVMGHILFFPIVIKSRDSETESLALAPLSVSPEFQKMGVGGRLIHHGVKIAQEIGYGSAIVLGHPKYYSRFGFVPAIKWNIKAPFEVPEDALMAMEFEQGALKNAGGIVEYPLEFSEL